MTRSEVATCAGCGAPLLQRTDDDGRVWLKCTDEHGWMRVPFLDTDRNTEDWRERRKQELARVRVRWDRADRQTTNFNGFMEEDRFVALSDAQAVLIAIGALEEDELGEQAQAEEFAVDRVAAKLGWPIKQTLDGVCSLEERGFVEVCH